MLAELPAAADDGAAAPARRRRVSRLAPRRRADRQAARVLAPPGAAAARPSTPPRMLHSLADMLRRTLDQRIRIEVEVPPADLGCSPTRGSSSRRCSTSRSTRAMRCRTAARCASGPSSASRLPDEVAARDRRRPAGRWLRGDRDRRQRHRHDGRGARARLRALLHHQGGGPRHRPGPQHRVRLRPPVQRRGHARQHARAAAPTVTLYLPRPAPRAAPAPRIPRSGRTVPRGLAVLLVEDDAEVRAVMRRFLEALGCEVTEAASGEQALLLLDAGAASTCC